MDAPGVPIVGSNGVGAGVTAAGRKAPLPTGAGAPAPVRVVANGKALHLKAPLATPAGWGNGRKARPEAAMRGQASEVADPGRMDSLPEPGGGRAVARIRAGVPKREPGARGATGRVVDRPGLMAVGRGAWTATGRKAPERGPALARGDRDATTG